MDTQSKTTNTDLVIRPKAGPTADFRLNVGPMRVIKRGKTGIDIHILPVFANLMDGRRCPLIFHSPIFETNGVYCFDNDKFTGEGGGATTADTVESRRTLCIDNGACPWLEYSLNQIREQLFPLLIERMREGHDKLPAISRRLLSPGATLDSCMRKFFDGENCHWFKLSRNCKIFDAESGEELEGDSGLKLHGFYKIRLRLTSIFLGTLGNATEACCQLNLTVDQILVKKSDTSFSSPSDLVLELDEFKNIGATSNSCVKVLPIEQQRGEEQEQEQVDNDMDLFELLDGGGGLSPDFQGPPVPANIATPKKRRPNTDAAFKKKATPKNN